MQDLLALLGAFGASDSSSDGNGDGAVDVVDLLALLGEFGNTCSSSGGGDCSAETTVTITGSNTRSDNGDAPGWFELAEVKLFTADGTNVAPDASGMELLLQPSNSDAIGVLTDGNIFDWTGGRFVVWQSSHEFHGEDLVRMTFDSPQAIVSAELYSTNYESFGTDAVVTAGSRVLPLRIIFSAHPNQGAAHAHCYTDGVEAEAPCSTMEDQAAPAATCGGGSGGTFVESVGDCRTSSGSHGASPGTQTQHTTLSCFCMSCVLL